ncbi:hypothetical protein MMC30_003314 [Trapelia coarctata]|nr:hypothetical protein [Trapelia coarctata]
MPTPFGTARFFDALHKKRQSLDLEVERYKALKDEEYRRFESELRKFIQDQVVNEGATREQSNGVQLVSQTQTENNGTGSRRNSGEKSPSPTGTMLDRLRSEAAVKTQKKENNRTAPVPAKSPEPVLDTPSHEREIEFQGLFTPRYLPLLEDPNRYSRKKTTSSSSPPPENPEDPPNGRRERPTPLSSSATLPATRYSLLHSPLQSPKFSNSAPRPRLQDLRRSSSRSDTSIASLRSSLKQPKSPRSSKHVLFAIDNNVLSPSTSPILERSGKGLNFASPIKEIQVPQRGSVPEVTSYFPRSPIRSYHQLVEPTVAASADGGADFEDTTPDEDALFSFDEDTNPGDDETTYVETNDGGSDAEDNKHSSQTTNSPHAGSLPIEIKWPAQRGSRR